MMKLSTIALAVASTAVGTDANDYARTCKSWKVTGVNNVVLRACCLDARGYWKISELHLKHCLANHDGLVKYREGNFHKSCDSCSVQSKPNSAYTCRCYIQGEEQGWYFDTFNKLDDIIFNRDGKLGCFSSVGGDKGTDSGCRGYGAQLLMANGATANGTIEEEEALSQPETQCCSVAPDR